MYTLGDFNKAKDQLIASSTTDSDLAYWLLLNERLYKLLEIPEVCEYADLLSKKLPVLYANSKSIQLLQEINLAIRQLQEGEEKGVNMLGQIY